jgi:hypothetical protein
MIDMRLTSSAFLHDAQIPRRYTCDGEDVSPPLEWTGSPAATRSFVVLCDDPDAPGGTWHHWAAYDIPASLSELAQGASHHSRQYSFTQATNDFQRIGYGGPCPPRQHGLHRYHFRLLALSIEQLSVRDEPSCREVEHEARKHALAEAILVGLYER